MLLKMQRAMLAKCALEKPVLWSSVELACHARSALRDFSPSGTSCSSTSNWVGNALMLPPGNHFHPCLRLSSCSCRKILSPSTEIVLPVDVESVRGDGMDTVKRVGSCGPRDESCNAWGEVLLQSLGSRVSPFIRGTNAAEMGIDYMVVGWAWLPCSGPRCSTHSCATWRAAMD